MERLKQRINEVNEIMKWPTANSLFAKGHKRTRNFDAHFYISNYHEIEISDKYPLEYEIQLGINVFYYDTKTKIKATKEILRISGEYKYTDITGKRAFFDDVLEHFQKILMFGENQLDIHNIRMGNAIMGTHKTTDKNGNLIYYIENKSTEFCNKTFNELIKEVK